MIFSYIKGLFRRIKKYFFPPREIELNSWDPLILKIDSN
jgi:hypothetical protein